MAIGISYQANGCHIAVAQYSLQSFTTWKTYQDHFQALLSQCKQHHAQILLLPENAGMALANLSGKFTVVQQLEQVQERLSDYLAFLKKCAHTANLYILSGTLPVRITANTYRNRAFFFGPDTDKIGFQDKFELTPVERVSGLIQSGDQQSLFNTAYGKVGIAICYDVEFPQLIYPLIYGGASLILMPSYTSTMEGYNRVRIAARARAMEGQCFVARACTVGKVKLGKIAETSVGSAGVYGPVDKDFPEDGILVEGELNQPSLIFTHLACDKLPRVRRYGQTRNFRDGEKYYGSPSYPVVESTI